MKKRKRFSSGIEKDLGLGNLEGGMGGEVFNVPGNEYTYDEARALCKAYGAKMATYSQIKMLIKVVRSGVIMDGLITN